jgi:hypothetical protein
MYIDTQFMKGWMAKTIAVIVAEIFCPPFSVQQPEEASSGERS